MFRDITVGQYYRTDSILHRLDPRVKLLGVVVYIAAVFVISNIFALIGMLIVLGVLIALSKVPLSYILRGMKMILFLMIVAVFFNLFFTDGEILWQWWIFKISREGILRAVFFAVRLMLVVVGASLLTYTTTPTTLTGGLEKVFSPLKAIKFPAHEMAMMMSIALRFIPILTEETDKIMKAQSARGADFDSGNIIQKAKALVPILVPLFVSAFRRANDLAMAMEARCYHGGEGRTKMKPLRYGRRDLLAYLAMLLYLVVLISVNLLAKEIFS